jgi:pyridoxal phosphate enzyme (YggS family)
MSPIAANLQAVHERIAGAARAAGRRADEIVLVAVSKTFPAAMIEEAHAAGHRIFGENQAQEGVKKVTRLAQLALEWHFIGPIQSNKTRTIAEHFQWVHSIEREKIAERLDAARPAGLPPLNVCIQINLSGEGSKSGVAPGDEAALADAISRMPRLRLRGLMAIPEPTAEAGRQRRQFALLREMKDRLAGRGVALDTLSMGMSDDFEAAILEGSTMVRVGTAIFGQRQRRLETGN